MLYFGEPWDAPIHDDNTTQVDTPLGIGCCYCADPILEGDSGILTSYVETDGEAAFKPIHRECMLRSVVGGLEHVQGKCLYRGHCNVLRVAAGRSRREDAIAVWNWVQKHGVP